MSLHIPELGLYMPVFVFDCLESDPCHHGYLKSDPFLHNLDHPEAASAQVTVWPDSGEGYLEVVDTL